MRTLPKYVFFSCAAVSIAWAAVTVEVSGRTPYGHFLKAGGASWVAGARASWTSAVDAAGNKWHALTEEEAAASDRAAPPKKARQQPRRAKTPDRPKPAVQEQTGAERRVALLKAAQKKVEPRRARSSARATHLDDPTTKADRAALDRLVAER